MLQGLDCLDCLMESWMSIGTGFASVCTLANLDGLGVVSRI
jgi:hypothetical protein